MDEADRAWWKEATVYQVYPRSFADSDGDGVGDLAGLAARADYLADLGVDAVWLNPVYESPMADNGYDVADYRAIDDTFGTMADWRAVRDALHERDIRLVMDFVPNHTSDEHEWFRTSRRRGATADWYHWADGVDADAVAYDATDEGPAGEAPPNNWRSFFGGPAWAYDDEREQWYLHLFDPKQPDLDWSVPAVREAMYDELRYWLDEGIDGFRLDVVNLLSKPDGYPSGDPDEPFNGTLRAVPNGPRIHEYVAEMHDAVFADRDLLTVGECIGDTDVDDAARYVGADGDGLSMVFHFDHVGIGRGEALWEREEWALTDLKAVFDRWQTGLEGRGWNSLYFNNHDQPRVVSRFGDDGEYRRESAACIATLLHTLRGTPYVYQGEELGMTNPTFESLAEFRDVETVRTVREAIEDGDIDSFEAVREGAERPLARHQPDADAVDGRPERRLHRPRRRAVDPPPRGPPRGERRSPAHGPRLGVALLPAADRPPRGPRRARVRRLREPHARRRTGVGVQPDAVGRRRPRRRPRPGVRRAQLERGAGARRPARGGRRRRRDARAVQLPRGAVAGGGGAVRGTAVGGARVPGRVTGAPTDTDDTNK
ncbi:alpha-glucosidase [Halobaculum litoreum]|uniref:alpha-glucosidase n=1 Tax=Halobaculum litoreum TaxID=3031998 RepID=UPI0024C2494E|nr:alpha-glucosidase [Halobaculum sp. DT92]